MHNFAFLAVCLINTVATLESPDPMQVLSITGESSTCTKIQLSTTQLTFLIFVTEKVCKNIQEWIVQ